MSLTEAVENGRLGSAFEDLQDTVRTERKRTTAERRAFEAFGRRVRRLLGRVDQPSPGTVIGNGVASVTSSIEPFQTDQSAILRTTATVRTAYEETVMSVAHYESEYNDTYKSSVHAEFGEEIGAALTRPGQFSTVSLQALIGKITEAIEDRNQLETVLDRELRSLSRPLRYNFGISRTSVGPLRPANSETSGSAPSTPTGLGSTLVEKVPEDGRISAIGDSNASRRLFSGRSPGRFLRVSLRIVRNEVPSPVSLWGRESRAGGNVRPDRPGDHPELVREFVTWDESQRTIPDPVTESA